MTSLLSVDNVVYKNHMNTPVIALWRIHKMSSMTSVPTMRFYIFFLEIIWKAIKTHFAESYDKQNPTRVDMSYETHETRQWLNSLISY